MIQPVTGINSGGVTSSRYTVTGGADMETDDELRTRMLAKYRRPRRKEGAATDYVEWALEVPGCSRAWVEPQGKLTRIGHRVSDVRRRERRHRRLPDRNRGRRHR